MANVVYLEPADYSAFGVDPATDPSVILRASLIIDGFLDRRDGLLYTVQSGVPVYMSKTLFPIREILEVPLSQHVTLSYTPLVSVLSIKSNQKFRYNSCYPNSAPFFQDITNFTFMPGYSDLWMGSAFPRSEAIIQYIGGWTYDTLPSEIKQACANIVNLINDGIISGNVRKWQAGDTSITFGVPNTGIETLFVDEDTARMIVPWRRTFR